MKLKYNAPVTLSFALMATVIQIISTILGQGSTEYLFSAPGAGSFSPTAPLDYFRLVSHVLGHSGWEHLVGNFTFILLLGPILEEKYQSSSLIFMMVITALVTGILNTLFLSTGLMGASGIVFMMILMASFTNIKSGEIPLTFIVVTILFLGKEFINATQNNDISEFAHIIGVITGALFGFLAPVLNTKVTKS